MKLLFDQNLSFKLCGRLSDLFPESSQVRQFGLEQADDRTIWEFAKSHDHIVVTQDSDFADLAALRGPPPKVVWLRCGNQPTDMVEQILRDHAEAIKAFHQDSSADCLQLL